MQLAITVVKHHVAHNVLRTFTLKINDHFIAFTGKKCRENRIIHNYGLEKFRNLLRTVPGMVLETGFRTDETIFPYRWSNYRSSLQVRIAFHYRVLFQKFKETQ